MKKCQNWRIKRNCWQQVYRYKEIGIESIAIVVFFSLFYYRTLYAVLALWPIGIWYFRKKKKEKLKRQEYLFRTQFRDYILTVSTNLGAGYSVENAFGECLEDMDMLYGSRAEITVEVKRLRMGLKNNNTLEQLLRDMAQRHPIEEIMEFVEIISVAKKSGGQIVRIMRETAEKISDKMEVDEEIEVMLTEKKLEQKVMSIVPYFIAGYIELTAGGYYNILFHNAFGVVIMSFCLMLYLLSEYLAQKIIAIQV